MHKYNIKLAFRNLLKNKTYSIINIVGLSIGLTCCIIIYSWILFEKSFNQQHKNAELIHHASMKGISDNDDSHQMTVSPVIAQTLKDKYPEVENAARYGFIGEAVLKRNETMFIEEGGIGADSSLFSIMSYSFVRGNPKSAFQDKYSIILTESMAEKYFGNANPMNETLRMNDKHNFVVRGIIKDIALSDHRRFDYVVPFSFLKEIGVDIDNTDPFSACNNITFLQLRSDVNLKQLNQKIAKDLRLELKDITFEICLVPLLEIRDLETKSQTKIIILSFIGLFILCLACLNFINQSTAIATTRAKEIGMRKVEGARRISIIKQFLGESFLITLLAGAIALLLSYQILSYYNYLYSTHIPFQITNVYFILGFIGILILTGLMAGLYPAFYLASFNPIQILNKQINKRSGMVVLRKGLIIFQFAITIIFIVSSLIIKQQSKFIFDFDAGFNKQNVLYIPTKGNLQKQYPVVKQELLKLRNVEKVASSSNLPNRIYDGSFTQWGKKGEPNRRISITWVDFDYLEMFDMKMADGRFYSRDFPTDLTNGIIVNEKAIKKGGLNNWVGNVFSLQDHNFNLIGVIRDFHHKSPVDEANDPVIFGLRPENNDYMFVRINSTISPMEMSATIDQIRKTCQQFSYDRPLQYAFLDDNKIESEQELEMSKHLIQWVSILAILISCLGLWGLSSFINLRRIKEIGVRKVNGAKIYELLYMLNKDFSILVFIAFILACPIAYYAMTKWLENFALKTTVSWWIFALAGLAVLLIALITVSRQTWRAARRNPVEALRYE